MSEPSSTSEPSQPAKSIGVFGCLIILVVLTAVCLFVAASFAARPKADGSVIVSDGLFSNVALKNYILLASTFGATGSVWRFALFSAVVFVLWIGQKIVVQRLLLPRIKRAWLTVPLTIVSGLGLLGILITAFASLMALSRGRVEDELALQSLGLSFLSQASLAPSLFSSRGGLLLAIPGVLVSFISEVAESAEAQKHGETRLTFNWLGWGCMLFLMPRAIAIAAFVMLLWNTVSEIAGQETS